MSRPPMINRSNDMSPTELKIAMMRAGVSQKAIAERLNVSGQAVHLVVYNRATSHRIRKAIAEALGMDLKRIWPSNYLYFDGPRKAGRPSTR